MAGTLYFIVLLMSFILLIRHYFTVRSNRQTAKLKFEELLYLESLGDYIEFHLANGSTISSKEKISHMERELPDGFLRIHRSFIVNQSKISSFSREYVVVGEKELPVSRSYRQEVVGKLNGK